MPLAPSTTSDPLRTPPPSGPDGSFSPSELVGCGPVQADDWPAVPLWFSCRNAAHTMDQRKGEPMLTGLTQEQSGVTGNRSSKSIPYKSSIFDII